MPERLQKIIARAGIASRRKAEELISAGRVTVNGAVVQELGTRADPATDRVCVDGKDVQGSESRRYLVMHKPKGCITSTSDPEGRTTVMDLIGTDASRGLFPVGRLDYNSEGLLIVTDDGEFANRILAAKNKIPKTYEVKISGRPSVEAIQKLRDGIKLDGRLSVPESIRLIKPAANPWYEITLVEGRNRQIHRMFERIGFLVEKIRRVSIGNLTLRGLEPRQVRELQPREIERLFEPRPIERPPRKSIRPDGRKFGRDDSGRRAGRTRPNRSAGPRSDGERRDGRSRTAERPPRRDSRPAEREFGRADRGPRTGRTKSDWPGKSRGGSDRKEARSRPAQGRPKRSSGPGVKRAGRPQQPRASRPPTSARSPARARPSGRAGSPRHNSTRSRAPRSSRPGSKARP